MEPTMSAIFFLLDNKKFRYKCAHAAFPNITLNGKRCPGAPPIPKKVLATEAAASPTSIAPTANSIVRDSLDTNFANVRCRVKESALRHRSDVISTLMKASRTDRQAVNIAEHSLLLEEVTTNVRTSEPTHNVEMISRSNMGPKMRIGRMDPPVDWDRNHGGECVDRASSNWDTVEASP
mmetsp:Transcript_30698/g.64891  ORF Transcript_30698/g.64891 Transcript_30698/m.64891 type:complete len:179 (-) Transcript_30698:543-1079(-)